MSYHIKKEICNREVYYKGNDSWADKYQDRKVYSSEQDAIEAQYSYSGVIVNESNE
jgi:hypothetical protein